MSEPFRTAQSVTPPQPIVEDEPATTAVALSPPQQTNAEAIAEAPGTSDKVPYVASYLEIENIWQKHPELKNDINHIEGYLRTQVAEGKLENSEKAKRLFLSEFERKAGTHPYESANQRITKILAYINFRKVVDS